MARNGACLVVIMLVLITTLYNANGELTCTQVYSALEPCLGFLSGGPAVSSCCSGVESLFMAAGTTQDRQTACACLKSAANVLPGNDLSRAAGLPAQCGITIPYQISPNTDCTKIN